MDSGIRSGQDVRSLGFGRAALIGRAMVYGLGAGGAGVQALQIIQGWMSMALTRPQPIGVDQPTSWCQEPPHAPWRKRCR